MSLNSLNTARSNPLIFVVSEKGGVRKTFTAIAIIDYLRRAGIQTRNFQIDQQGRLTSAFPDSVTIELPAVSEFRANELADGSAFEPLDEAILTAEGSAIVVDVGANLDVRTADFAVAAGWDSEASENGRDVYVFTPFLLDADSILLASRSARRMKVAFPASKIIPVSCGFQNEFDGFPSPDMADLFIRGFGRAQLEFVMTHPPIFSKALHYLETSGTTPTRFVELDARNLAKHLNTPRVMIKMAQADVAIYIVTMREQLQRVLPFRYVEPV